MDKEVIVSNFIDENTKSVEDCIVPIYTKAERSRLSHIGTSVYLLLENRHFLITANHVVENNIEYWIPVENGKFETIPGIEAKFIGCSAIDIAVIELSKQLLFTPLQISNIYDHKNLKNFDNTLILMGFPSSKVKTKLQSSEGILQKFITQNSTDEEYKRLGVNKEIGIVIDFNEKQVKSPGKGIKKFPDPHGISGGGLFWMDNKGKTSKNVPAYLIGIVIEKDKNNRGGIVAIKINYGLAMIKHKYKVNMPKHLISGIKCFME